MERAYNEEGEDLPEEETESEKDLAWEEEDEFSDIEDFEVENDEEEKSNY